MCGISLILSNIHIVGSSPNLRNGLHHVDFQSLLQEETLDCGTPYPTIDDIKDVVSRRGPDHVGLERLQLKVVLGHGPEFSKGKEPIEREEDICVLDKTSSRSLEGNEKLRTFVQMINDTETETEDIGSQMKKIEPICQEHMSKHKTCGCDAYEGMKSCIVANFVDGINGEMTDAIQENTFAEILFLGATLQLRGVYPVFQPLVDSWMNVLVYNGEVFGGISVGKEESDTTVLMNALEKCCSCPCHASGRDCNCCQQRDHISVPQLLSTVKGPWALIYWQAKSKIVWFGRDAFGRRSLLVHWPSVNDSRLLLSSVAPLETDNEASCRRSLCRGDQDEGAGYIRVQEVNSLDDNNYWNELACGIYSISLESAEGFGCNVKKPFVTIVGRVEKHDWSNPQLKKLLNWKRSFVEPGSNDSPASNFTYQIKKDTLSDRGLESVASHSFEATDCIALNSIVKQKNAEMQVSCGTFDSYGPFLNNKIQLDTLKGDSSMTSVEYTGSQGMAAEFLQDSFTCSVHRVLFALKQAVIRRTCHAHLNQLRECGESIGKHVPIAVLFSGGLDSMILAALLDQCLEQSCEIDLLNVSFDGPHAPDRISAKAGITELQRIAPFRRWRLVEIDADPSNLQSETKYLTSLIHPAKTYMDLNIGTALWLAARGDGWVEEEEFLEGEDECFSNDSCLHSARHKKFKRRKYKSQACILLVGSGADEQCAGYGRHRTKFRLGGWVGLQEEMKIDVQRIWKRNLGRDDRCIADHGKEARFPFLDEDVIETLLDIPLWEIADLEKPSGQGDKKILREVARVLGLQGASTVPKRAIQFGSRIARESNRRNFGSNRAANQASAGSVVIHCLRE